MYCFKVFQIILKVFKWSKWLSGFHTRSSQKNSGDVKKFPTVSLIPKRVVKGIFKKFQKVFQELSGVARESLRICEYGNGAL